MSVLIPTVGTRGLFQLLAPFDTALLPNVPYTVAAVRRLGDFIAAGSDPKEEFYTPAGITNEKYEEDLQAGVCIVSLRSDVGGQWVYVPHTYVQEAPAIGGIPYTTLALAISLGPVPESVDLSYLKTRITDVVLETLGVESETKTLIISPTTILSNANHEVIEAARQVKISSTQTDYARLLVVTAERDAARNHIQELELFIRNNFVPPAP